MKITENKHIGVILAIATLFLVFMSNGLFYILDIEINISINGLPFYVNCILFIFIVLSFLLFKAINNSLIYFIISVFILQNVFISGLDDVLYRLVGFDSNREGSFVFIIPTTIIGIIIWGVFFDYRRRLEKDKRFRL